MSVQWFTPNINVFSLLVPAAAMPVLGATVNSTPIQGSLLVAMS